MAQKVQINHESRVFDFVYDPTYALSARDFSKAESIARHHFLSARHAKSNSLDLQGLLTVRPLFTTDHQSVPPTENDTTSSQSVVVHGRQSPRYVSSVNRYKFYSAPLSAGDRHKPVSLSKPVLYTPVQTPLIPEEDCRPSMKTDLELSLRSSSSGYHSVRSHPVPTSAKVQAIIERLYHGHQPGRQCSQCSYGWPTGDDNGQSSSLPQSPSLPQVNAKDIELVESMRAKRRLGRRMVDHTRSTESLNKSQRESSPVALSSNGMRNYSPRRFASPVRSDYQHVDHLRQKLASHTEHLRKEIEEKLKRMRIHHERALQRLQNEHKPRVRDRSETSSVNLSTIESLSSTPKLRQKRKPKEDSKESKYKTTKPEINIVDNYDNSVEVNKITTENNSIVSTYEEENEEVASSTTIDVGYNVNEISDVSNDNHEENKIGDESDNLIQNEPNSSHTKTVVENVTDVTDTFIENMPQTTTLVEEDVVDASTVQDEIIKPFIDYIISDSIISLANYRANEEIALKLSGRKCASTFKDINDFLSKDVLPTSINLVRQVLLNNNTSQ